MFRQSNNAYTKLFLPKEARKQSSTGDRGAGQEDKQSKRMKRREQKAMEKAQESNIMVSIDGQTSSGSASSGEASEEDEAEEGFGGWQEGSSGYLCRQEHSSQQESGESRLRSGGYSVPLQSLHSLAAVFGG